MIVRVSDSFEVRPAYSELARTMKHPKTRLRPRELIEDCPCSVGRAVVHENDIRTWRLSEQLGDHPSHVVSLVVCGNEDE